MSRAYPCPCCGHLTFSEPPGSYEICRVCGWEDDAVQLRWPGETGGANEPSLIEAQLLFAESGQTSNEPLDPKWRPIDRQQDSFEELDEQVRDWPDDLTTLYWWRPGFWRTLD